MQTKIKQTLFILGATLAMIFGCESEGIDAIDCNLSKPFIDLKSTTDADCGENNGAISVEASGEGELSYSLGGSIQSTGDFPNLSAGEYLVEVADENGCSSTITVIVKLKNTTLGITATATEVAGCGTSNGVLSVVGSGGEPPYLFSLNGTNFQEGNEFDNLSLGEYNVFIKDNLNCITKTNVKIFSGVSFSGEVKNIIDTNCAISGCHVSGTGRPDFTSLTVIQTNALNIKTKTGNKSMPKNGSLTNQEIELIACWVDDGAKNN